MNDKKDLNVVLKNVTKCVAKNLFRNKLEITILEPYNNNIFLMFNAKKYFLIGSLEEGFICYLNSN
jgi:hypothetical protein